jgi:hypothetical protein
MSEWKGSMTSHTRYWFKFTRPAKRWLDNTTNRDQLAVKTLLVLNRLAKSQGYRKGTIYQLKNLLIKRWYQEGKCVYVTSCYQNLPCWTCDGTGIYTHYNWQGEPVFKDTCNRCLGDGIYKTVQLAKFDFRIEGQWYSWHQPKDLIWEWLTWYNSNKPTEYITPATQYTYRMSQESIDVMIEVLAIHLGVTLNLWQAIKRDLRKFKVNWRYWYFGRWFGRLKMRYLIWRYEYNDIPF